jgi:beta-lactamase regulating signal transducer with metallopeptidase domain
MMVRGRIPARWYYFLWLLVLVRMVTPWIPVSRMSVFNLVPVFSEQNITGYVRAEHGGNILRPSQVVDKVDAEAITSRPETFHEEPQGWRDVMSAGIRILPLIWLTGAAILAVVVFIGNFNLWRAVKSERLLTDKKVLDLLEDCKKEMGTQTVLGVVVSDKVKSPALFGFVRPRLLLPAGIIETLKPGELRHLFLHELAHLKRHDIGVSWVMAILQVMHWFNPFIWFGFYQMRVDRELACDGLVLSAMGADESPGYGRTIIHLLERFSPPRRLPCLAGVLEDKSQIRRRIDMIGRFRKRSHRWSVVSFILIILAACVSLTDARSTTLEMKGEISEETDLVLLNGDLRIAAYPEGKDLYTAFAVIHNRGNKTIPRFRLNFYSGDPADNLDERGRAHGDSYHRAGPIEPGGVWEEMCFPFALEEGVNEISVVLDLDNIITESDETNNAATVTVVIKEGKIVEEAFFHLSGKEGGKNGGVDLSIGEDGLEIHRYSDGGLYYAVAPIQNEGDSISPRFTIYFYRTDSDEAEETDVSARPIGNVYQGVRPMEPGEVCGKKSMPFDLREGVNEIGVIIDPGNTLAETDETNNQALITVVVKEGRIVSDTR